MESVDVVVEIDVENVFQESELSDLLSGHASYIKPFALCVSGIGCFHLPSILQLVYVILHWRRRHR